LIARPDAVTGRCAGTAGGDPQALDTGAGLPAVLLIAMRCAVSVDAGVAVGLRWPCSRCAARVLAFDGRGPLVIGWMRSGWWRGRGSMDRRRDCIAAGESSGGRCARTLLQRGRGGDG